MEIFKMRANICTYFKNAGPLVSYVQNIDILSGSPRSANNLISPLKFKFTGDFCQKKNCSAIQRTFSAKKNGFWQKMFCFNSPP